MEMLNKVLAETVVRVARQSPYYKNVYEREGIQLGESMTVADFERIPLTTKDDVQAHAMDFWAATKTEILDYSSTSGTQGKPVTVPLTDGDLTRLAAVEAHSFKLAGIGPDDTILLTTTINRRFMAGLAYQLGARAIGAGIVRTGPGLISHQIETIFDLTPTVIIAVPSFIAKMLEYAKEAGIDLAQSSVRKIICIGESIQNADFSPNSLARHITDQWDVELFSTYASSEMQTAFTSCSQHMGGHVNESKIFIEILDDNGAKVPDGTVGELVITTLGVEGFPLIRFRTGDVCALHTTPCPCGDPSPRIGPVLGRLKQMIKCKGTTCYPQALFNVLDEDRSVKDYQVQVEHDDLGNDKVTVFYVAGHGFDPEDLKRKFKSQIRFTPEIRLISDADLQARKHPEENRKSLSFLDLR